MENTSGGGGGAQVPVEIERWNWGAFLLTWIWGIGNGTFIAFLMFVPFVNIVMPFVLGAKGSAWAWRNRRWESVQAFKLAQRKWARWGVLVCVLVVLLSGGAMFAALTMIKHSQAYQMAARVVQSSPRSVRVLGQPVETGFPMGSIRVSGPQGEAHLSFSVEGPKGHGEVYVKATRSLGQWRLDQVVLKDDGSGRRIDLEP